ANRDRNCPTALTPRSNCASAATHALLDPLFPALPQPRLQHPLTHRLAAHRDLVVPRQILARQRRTEVGILPLDDRYCFLLDLVGDLVCRGMTAQTVDNGPGPLDRKSTR